MGITERKERERAVMRQRIIDGALKMFINEGYEKTSIRNIAEKIEYSPATIYLYYKDKDELLYEIQRLAFGKLIKTFEENATSSDPLEKLEQICFTYMRFGWENPEMYDLMFIIRAPMNVVHDSAPWTNGHDAFGFLMQCLHDCMQKQLVKFENPITAALSVWAMAHGLISLDIRCRIKVMDLNDEQIAFEMNRSMKQYLACIRK